MRSKKYDIFLSYNHQSGHTYARIIQILLEQRGYKVFYDFENLSGNPRALDYELRSTCKVAPIYMIILSCGVFESNYVRNGIAYALQENKIVIPINPNNEFDGFPSNLREDVKNRLASNQWYDMSFDSSLTACINQMIKDRIAPIVGERISLKHFYLKILRVTLLIFTLLLLLIIGLVWGKELLF